MYLAQAHHERVWHAVGGLLLPDRRLLHDGASPRVVLPSPAPLLRAARPQSLSGDQAIVEVVPEEPDNARVG